MLHRVRWSVVLWVCLAVLVIWSLVSLLTAWLAGSAELWGISARYCAR